MAGPGRAVRPPAAAAGPPARRGRAVGAPPVPGVP